MAVSECVGAGDVSLADELLCCSDYVNFHCHNDVNGFEAVIVPRGLTTGQQKKGLILFNVWLVFQTL